MKNRWLLAILGLLFLLLAAVVGLICYQAATLKGRLAESLGQKLGARVEFSSLSLDFWKGELHAAGITLTNRRSDAPWDKGEISQAVVHYHLADIFSPTMPLTLEVTGWNVNLRPSMAPSSTATSATVDAASPSPSSSQREIKVTQLTASEGDVTLDLSRDRQILIHGVAFQSGSNGGDVWTTQAQAASVTSGSLVTGVTSVELRSESDKISFSGLRMQCADGFLTGEGAVSLAGEHVAQATLKATNVPIIMLVAVAWQMKLSGLVSGDLSYAGNDQSGEAKGQLSLAGGKFNILPFLGKMAAVVGLPDITGMEVDKATSDFDWKDHTLHLSNMDIRKNNVTRIAGQVDLDANDQVDGHLKLGLPNSILARWPQLQSNVFSVPLEDYGWAEVHLTGTPDHLQEDLSARVLAAGFQGGNGLINQGAQNAMDLLKGFMGQ